MYDIVYICVSGVVSDVCVYMTCGRKLFEAFYNLFCTGLKSLTKAPFKMPSHLQ